MDIKDACEQAYKNGYKDGAKKFAKRLKEEVAHIPAWGRVAEKKIDNLLKEMEGKINEKL